MADIVIIYGTTEGQTRKIARHAADYLTREKHHVSLIDAADAPEDLDDRIAKADGVVLAASVHMARHNAAVARVVDTHKAALDAKPGAFVSVSLGILSEDADERAEAEAYAADFFHTVGWTPRAVLHAAGALRNAEYDWIKRWMMRRIARQRGEPFQAGVDQEYTDWRALEAFVEGFAKSLSV